jgi:hypothetical protein
MSKPRQACVDCHFLTNERRVSDTTSRNEVSEAQRNQTRGNDLSWHRDSYCLMCDFLVWDEGFKVREEQLYEIIVETEREDCFFWPWHPGMLLPAARVLQERAAVREERDRELRLTRRGLRFAGIALLINAAAFVANTIPSGWWKAAWHGIHGVVQ